MGSFQQISIGLICLVAAFAFGNYVNTHPPGDHPHDVAAGKTVSGSAPGNAQSQPVGNVQSRPAGGIELIQKQPASIATMRNRLKPRFAMPQADAPKAAVNSDPNPIPPPSYLGAGDAIAPPSKSGLSTIDLSNPLKQLEPFGTADPSIAANPLGAAPSVTRPNSITPRTAKANDVPDFSSIMNELKDSPIALKPLGNMPRHSMPMNNQPSIAIAKPRSNENVGRPLEDLANEFKTAVADREQIDSSVWNTNIQTEFTADDFAPRLKDRLSHDSTNQARPTEFEANPDVGLANEQGLTSHAVFTGGNDNHVVSRHVMPAGPYGGQPIGESVVPISRAQNARNAQARDAQVVPRERIAATSNQSLAALPNRQFPDQPFEDEYGTSVMDPPVPAGQSANRVRTMLPFKLTDQGKQQLVAITSRANSQLALNTTKFVDHVIQPGETLQSISKRYFGKPDFYLDIYLANRNRMRNPVDAQAGVAIRIPIYEQ